MRLDVINSELIAATPYFSQISPQTSSALRGTPRYVVKVFKGARTVYRSSKRLLTGEDPAKIAGEWAGNKVITKTIRPVSKRVHKRVAKIDHDRSRKNGMGGRTWITRPGRYDMVMVFHDANRAGPHVDVHIGRLSVVYRVKPDVYSKLRYNRDGQLTEASRELLISHVKSEIATGSRVPQNLDHSRSNARASWVNGDPNGKNYGDGRTRQVILQTEVDVYKAHEDGPVEFYAPALHPDRALYLYRLYPGDNKRAPILIWGKRRAAPPELDDRLHLKMIHPDEVEKYADKADWNTSTAKYDGSSCFFVITKEGTTVWSPRTSVRTGEQIEYTHKLDGLATVTSDETIVGMGELLFREKAWLPWRGGYVPAAVGGGILNSNMVLPTTVTPEIRIYRIDRIGRQKVGHLDFWENRKLQQDVAKLSPKLKVVELMEPAEANELGFEGVVVVPENASVNDGFKLKWWEDPNDWRIDRVDFRDGEKGGVAGVVHATSLESGKKFKLGPGQVGNTELTREMMAHPERYEGVVLKVNSKRGHEGRAAKVVAIHTDKGVAPV